MCNAREHTSFMCMMALSTVLERTIFSYYPEVRMPKLEKYFNCKVSPRRCSSHDAPLHLLWTQDSQFNNTPNVGFVPNHFIPLVALLISKEHSASQIKKRDATKQVKLNALLRKEQKEDSTKTSLPSVELPQKQK